MCVRLLKRKQLEQAVEQTTTHTHAAFTKDLQKVVKTLEVNVFVPQEVRSEVHTKGTCRKVKTSIDAIVYSV